MDKDLSEARLLFTDRDASLDRPWGEGREVGYYEADDGYYERRYTYSLVRDEETKIRMVPRQAVIDGIIRRSGADKLPGLFPESFEARLVERFGVAELEAIADRAADLAAELPAVAAHGGERLHGEAGGPYVLVRVSADAASHELVRPDDAMAWLCGHGASTNAFAALFPASPETALLLHAGAPSWAELRAPLPGAEVLHRADDGRLVRLGSDLYAVVTAQGVTAHRGSGALEALIRADAPRDVMHAAFPDRDTWVELQRRAGIHVSG